MKEQIEKMAQEIFAFCVETCGDCNLIAGKPCESVMEEAEHLYNAGYRKQEWISVDDRLPENDYGKHWKERQRYLVCTEPNGLMYVAKYGYKEHGWWSDGGGYVLDEKNYRKVTHWMPLPEPPKMKGGAE